MQSRRSCDSCRFRKVKYNRMERLDQGEDGCTCCSSLGLACFVTPVKQREGVAKTRTGKRMKLLMDNQAAPFPSTSVDRNTSTNGRYDATASIGDITGAISDPTFKEQHIVAVVAPPPSSLQQQVCFLSVPGLSRNLLDSYLETFFAKLEPCMPLSCTASHFWSRYRAFLNVISGLDVYAGTPSITPLSELLVLAVACRGCDNTSHTNRFQMSKAMMQRFAQLATTGDTLHLANLDGIEAINLLSENVCRSKHPTAKGGQYPTILQFDVLGRGFATELALFMQLQMPLPDCTDEETERRFFLFWTVYMHDAFTSVAGCHMYRIMDEDIGWKARPTITSTATVAPQTTRPVTGYGYSMYRLALIARRMSRELMSVKAKVDKIQPSSVIDLLDSLQSWYYELEPAFCFDWDADSSKEQSQQVSPQELVLISSRAFMLSIFLSLHLNLWASTCNFWDPMASKEGIEHAQEALDEAMRRACFQMAALSRHCMKMNLVDNAPNNLRNVPAAWVLWCTRRVTQSYSSKSIKQHEMDRMHKACQDLVDCVASAKSCSDNKELVKSLQDVVDRAFTSRKRQPKVVRAAATTTSGGDSQFTSLHSTASQQTGASNTTLNPMQAFPAQDYMEDFSPIKGHPPTLANGLETEYPLYSLQSTESPSSYLSPDWEALSAVTAEVQTFLAGFGIQMPS